MIEFTNKINNFTKKTGTNKKIANKLNINITNVNSGQKILLKKKRKKIKVKTTKKIKKLKKISRKKVFGTLSFLDDESSSVVSNKNLFKEDYFVLEHFNINFDSNGEENIHLGNIRNINNNKFDSEKYNYNNKTETIFFGIESLK